MRDRPTRSEAVTSRMTDGEALRVGLAAQIQGTSRSSYIRRVAVQAAEEDLARIGTEGGTSSA